MVQTLLVVEDEESLRIALHDKLTREGFTVLEANDGAEGLALALDKHPDLILLDIIMPVMDGMTMLGKLREDVWGKNAAVIILTNLNDDERVQESIKHGAFEYLVKTDWKLEDVVTKIRAKLKK